MSVCDLFLFLLSGDSGRQNERVGIAGIVGADRLCDFYARYVPKTRSDLGIPPEPQSQSDTDSAAHAQASTDINYTEYFEDTPIYTLLMLIRQQLFAFPAYLLCNVSGQKGYPRW